MDSVSPRPHARSLRRFAAVAATAALVLGASFATATSASAAPAPSTITDASFTWGFSDEAGGGAYFGGCNFLSAGTAGNTGSSRLWTEADGFYKATDGANVSIVKPNAAGDLVAPTWSTKCQNPAGTAVSAASTSNVSKNAVKLSNGSGTTSVDGTSVINWTGSFTVVFYGGLTYWTVTDPTLTIDANGDGQLTGTASGYGTSMEDQTQWVTIAPQEIVLADVDGATVSDTGFTATPEYLGVSVTTASTAQSTTGTSWGSFPQSYVDFQQLTGQSSYWYSSGGARDAAKPASPLTVSYVTTAAEVEEPSTPPADDEQTIEVTVPTKDTTPTTPSGSFGWSFADAAAVSLGTATQAGSSFTAAGTLNTIVVTDTRAGGTAPYSWSISGQVGDFTSGANSFGAEYLGWTPTVSNAGAGVTAGAAVTSLVSGGAGLAESASLATSAAAANATINTELSLVLPDTTTAGDYTATLTVTALS